MQRKRIISCLLFACLLCVLHTPIQAKAKSYDYYTMYKNFAKKLYRESDSNKYMAIVNSAQPVLLIAEGVYSFDYDEMCMVALKAKVYQYSTKSKKILYVGEIYSNSTSCPISKKGKYIISYFHHYAEKTSFKEATGTMILASDGIVRSSKKIVPGYSISKINLKKGKRIVLNSNPVSEKKFTQKYSKYTNDIETVKFFKILPDSGKKYYFSHFGVEPNANSTDLYVSKISNKGNKIKIVGNVAEADSFSAYLDKNYSVLKDATFSLSNKCKFYTSGGSGEQKRITKRKFIKLANASQPSFVTISFKTGKKGKISSMGINFSM